MGQKREKPTSQIYLSILVMFSWLRVRSVLVEWRFPSIPASAIDVSICANSSVRSVASARRRCTLRCGTHSRRRQLTACTAGRPAGAYSGIVWTRCVNVFVASALARRNRATKGSLPTGTGRGASAEVGGAWKQEVLFSIFYFYTY